MQIHIYAKQGDIAGVASQIASGVDIDCVDQYSSQTPLMLAVTSPDADIDMIQFLIEHGSNVNAFEGEYQSNVLSLAVQSGNLDKIQFLLEAGSDINYRRPSDYDVLIDVMHGRDILEDQNLITILNLLITRGAKLGSISSYGESALRVASRVGRFDAVKVLLVAGDDPNQLEWTALMHTIALGSIEDMKALLDQGADLSARDYWDRTPWLLSLQVGELEKAKLLLSLGADRSDRGRCGKVPLMYPIENNSAEVLKWLIEEGFDLETTDDFGVTPLMVAAEYGATDCVGILLENGANPSCVNHCDDPAIKLANNMQIVRMLVQVGEDLGDINDDMRQLLTGVGNQDLQVTQEQYVLGKHSRFGSTNPELMEVGFWKAMVRSGCSAWQAKDSFNDGDNWDNPMWCYARFGRTITELPDGGIVEIAGEHEDSYDPDFCIYNDVVVYQGDGNFNIWSYPRDVFPPTDFHSATLVGEYIYIIGSLGYFGERIYNETPVYRLHCDTFNIEKMETTGDKPGWISRHKARYRELFKIYITGGKVCVLLNDAEEYIQNSVNYSLDLTNLNWSIVYD
jgi:ankyrin repeat protein